MHGDGPIPSANAGARQAVLKLMVLDADIGARFGAKNPPRMPNEKSAPAKLGKKSERD
jgi:hypothetical protein